MKKTKQKIALFYNARPKFGGWVTFTVYLYRSLQACGAEPYLFKIGNTSQTPRHFMDDVWYQKISAEDALELPQSFKRVIVATDKHHIEATTPMLDSGADIIVHDPTETRSVDLRNVMLKNSIEPIAIRPAIVENLRTLGIKSTFIKHPYLIHNETLPKKTKLAAATSRVDFDKYTEIIIEANKSLDEKVKIWGALNGMYAWVKLDKLHPDWKKDYYGSFYHDKVWKILNPSKYMLDLTAIVADGGGSQYTFLEGWDAGCVLILNKKWGLSNDTTMNPGKNCLFVDGAEELVEVLKSDQDYSEIVEAGREKVKEYDGKVVGHEYLEYFCGE